MNKTELIEKVAGGTITRGAAEVVINKTLDVIQEELAAGREVQLTGFGKFEAKASPARNGRNPKTGAPLRIEAGKRVRFVPGKLLKEAVNS